MSFCLLIGHFSDYSYFLNTKLRKNFEVDKVMLKSRGAESGIGVEIDIEKYLEVKYYYHTFALTMLLIIIDR